MLKNDAYIGERLSLGPEVFPKLMYLGLVGMKEFEVLDIFGPRRLQQLDFEDCRKAMTYIRQRTEIVSVNLGFEYGRGIHLRTSEVDCYTVRGDMLIHWLTTPGQPIVRR
ncbi:hypothetical protein MRB53_027502 [Persea americana]|uniref:Uncharacterized protein n=1 Tax=Persea americana TaxID=3435 RepID=A0ACC2LL00_PERAE|nr:hypothetical protein MRB53_027502 [Persea americana]